jgi:hypothetical protein
MSPRMPHPSVPIRDVHPLPALERDPIGCRIARTTIFSSG